MKFKNKMKKFFSLTRESAGGFTLVELIVVIAILGILAGVAIPAYSGYIKKANESADLQLLDSVNTAFAAACNESGIDPHSLTSAEAAMPLTAEGKVNVANVKPAGIVDAFEIFFAGNEDGVFKTYTALTFDPATGAFTGGKMSELYSNLMSQIISGKAEQIGLFKDSAFNEIGAATLLGQVTDVAGLASELIAGNSTLTGVVMDENYITSLANRLGKDPAAFKTELETLYVEDPTAFSQYMANSTVLNVAGTVNSSTFDEDAALDMFAAGNWGGLGTTLNTDPETGLAQVAMLYGLYTAYDQEAASNIAMNGDVEALVALKNDEEFKTYLSQVNTVGSDAYNDYQGYKAALNIVNESANNADVANDILANGYNNSELLALMQGVLAG